MYSKANRPVFWDAFEEAWSESSFCSLSPLCWCCFCTTVCSRNTSFDRCHLMMSHPQGEFNAHPHSPTVLQFFNSGTNLASAPLGVLSCAICSFHLLWNMHNMWLAATTLLCDFGKGRSTWILYFPRLSIKLWRKAGEGTCGVSRLFLQMTYFWERMTKEAVCVSLDSAKQVKSKARTHPKIDVFERFWNLDQCFLRPSGKSCQQLVNVLEEWSLRVGFANFEGKSQKLLVVSQPNRDLATEL